MQAEPFLTLSTNMWSLFFRRMASRRRVEVMILVSKLKERRILEVILPETQAKYNGKRADFGTIAGVGRSCRHEVVLSH